MPKKPNPNKMDCDNCTSTEGCTCGAPTQYKEQYVQEAIDYLAECVDSYKTEVDSYEEKEDGSIVNIRTQKRLNVSLPTIKSFAARIGHHVDTLPGWRLLHPAFDRALMKIEAEQHKRLLDSGLSGQYNPTIAKLILSSNHGYAEKKAVEHSGGIRIEDLID